MQGKTWWDDSSNRVIQYNLQVQDTPGMDAKRLAKQTIDLGANVVVMNVGGIYAWYSSKIPYHHINEYLPKEYDLLESLINEFHALGIKFIARFDFSITDDLTYLRKPEWFARHIDKSPFYRGEKRMGDWSLLLNTCATGGYRNEEVAVPVLEEVIDTYDIDGIFLNAPFANLCYCERCQKKYQELFGSSIPEIVEEIDSNWLSICTKDNISQFYTAIKAKKSNLPLILYYAPFFDETKAFGRIHRDSIYDRYATADLICTEAQNILSNGNENLAENIRPTMVMKAGQAEEKGLLPFGIIHSSPGMDWRHVGLPISEYLPWMSQIPAANGILWHSITGYPETVYDKRILEAVKRVNSMILKTEHYMHAAKSLAQVLLFWDGGKSARDWADLLSKNHISFNLMHDYRIDKQRILQHPVLIIPENLLKHLINMKGIVNEYLSSGGTIIAESTNEQIVSQYGSIFGTTQELITGEFLYASYMNIKNSPEAIIQNLDTDRLAFRGRVMYGKPKDSATVLATLIPPFAPLEVVGAPPERASIPVKETDIPLCIMNNHKKGKTFFFPCSISSLATEYGLSDHYDYIGNLISYALDGKKMVSSNLPADVIVSTYKTPEHILIHLVNEVGERPLMNTVDVANITMAIVLSPEIKIRDVKSVIAEEDISYEIQNDVLHIEIPNLHIWDMLAIEYKA